VHNALLPFAVTSFAEQTCEQRIGKLDRELTALERVGAAGAVDSKVARVSMKSGRVSPWKGDRFALTALPKRVDPRAVRILPQTAKPNLEHEPRAAWLAESSTAKVLCRGVKTSLPA
jgi:hypothetical protein